ncbi:MAG: hypothetical protein ACK55Z_37415, partial [bacterium]
MHGPFRCNHQRPWHMVAIIFRNTLADRYHPSFLARSKEARIVETEENNRCFFWQTAENFFQVRNKFVDILLGDFPTAFHELVCLHTK